MRMTARLQIPRLDLNDARRQIADAMTDALTKSAFEWVLATTALIPVWSGASLATFLQLSRAIGVSLPINKAPNAPDRESLGERNGFGDVVLDERAGKFSFKYETTLPHLIYNEFNNANVSPDATLFASLLTPGPYHFQDAGREAFLRSLDNVGLPDPRAFIKVKVKRVR